MSSVPASTDLQRLKLEVPRLPPSVVLRDRLILALRAVSQTRLILLDAPAGFGKTTLLSQWRDHLRDEGGHVGWLTLDEGDADVRSFLVGVIGALDAAGVAMNRLQAYADRGLSEITLDMVVREITLELSDRGAPVTLILDDYHRASAPTLDTFFERWIPLLPDNLQLVMSSRRAPNIGLHRLLGSAQAVEFTSEMLRFTPGESRQVIDVGLAIPGLDAVVRKAEGWPVALQLARLVALQGRSQGRNQPLSFDRLASRGSVLWTFLSDQVLHSLSAEAVDFLLETSILERFSVEITDAMQGRDDSWRLMEELEPLQSLLTPLDADAVWYRYHHLFAEYLQAQLRHRRPTELNALHLRASDAFARCGLLREAVRHASLAGHFERCAELVESAGGWRLVLYGGMGQLNQLLEFIPHSERLSHARLLLAQAYVSLKQGLPHEARSTFDMVAQDVEEMADHWSALDECERDIVIVNVLVRTYEDNRVNLPFLDFYQRAEGRTSDADGLTRGVLECAEAVACLCIGDLTRAETIARQAMAAMRSANSVLGLNYCFLHAGLACAYRGECRSAIAYLQRARAMAAENFGADSGLKALADTLLAFVELWRNEGSSLTAAALDEAFRHVCDYDGWFEVFAAGLDSRFRLARRADDMAAMQRVIADGDSLVAVRGLNRLASVVDAQRLIHAAASGDLPAALALAEQLSVRFPIGAWRSSPEQWRPYQDVGFALGAWLATRDPRQAQGRADDLLACAQSVGARPYEIRAHLLHAQIAELGRRTEDASAHLYDAVALAASEGISLPFFEQRGITGTIRRVRRALWDSGGSPVEASFLASIEESLARVASPASGMAAVLSVREQEVMAELSRGLTNKEIARALDMTEHTVKFHLKNVFAKLGVDRRAHALTAMRDTSGLGRA